MFRFLIFLALSFTLLLPNVHAEETQKPAKKLTFKEKLKRAAKKALAKTKAAAKKAAAKTKALAKKAAAKTKALAKKATAKTKAATKKLVAKTKVLAQKAKVKTKSAAQIAAQKTKRLVAKTKVLAKKAAAKTKVLAKKATDTTKTLTAKTKVAAKKAAATTKVLAQKVKVKTQAATKKIVAKTKIAAQKVVVKTKEVTNKIKKAIVAYRGATQVYTPSNILKVPQGTVLGMILKSGTVRVCVRSDVPPFGYFEGETLKGFDIVLAKKIISGISIRYNKTLRAQWTIINAKERIPSLQQGRCDLVVAAFSKTPERSKQVGFSNVYLRTHKVLLARKSVTRTPAIVATVSGTTGQSSRIPGARVASFFNYNEILGAMKRGLVDYVFTDHPVAQYLLKNSSGYTLKKVLKETESYAVGVHMHHTQLRKEINDVLSYLARSGHLAYFQRKCIQ